MENNTRFSAPLSGNMLKYIAALSMLLDHIGVIFFPSEMTFRILGRLALPIFAYMIAEGCRYTRNKLRYFLYVFGLAAACQLVYFIYDGDTYMCILVTFSLSILMIYALQFFKKCLFDRNCPVLKTILAGVIFFAMVGGTYALNKFLTIDYGFWGCMLPVFAALLHPTDNAPVALKAIDHPWVHALMLGVGIVMMVLLGTSVMSVQIYALLALPLLLLYSGKRGKHKMKYFFYIFYPTHLVALEFLYMLIH